jgi:hypothetical protein
MSQSKAFLNVFGNNPITICDWFTGKTICVREIALMGMFACKNVLIVESTLRSSNLNHSYIQDSFTCYWLSKK